MISRNCMTPKNGAAFKVLIIARISTKNQDLRSLDEQISLCKKHAVTLLGSGAIEYQSISSQSSGEILDRQELVDAEAAVDRGDLDMVIVEDLARFSRRNRAIDFCEQCQDKNTRFIAINDHIDTISDNWHIGGLIASFQHEQHNLKLAQRLKTRLRERFATGGALACLIYGYRKRPGATGDANLEKIPEAQPIIAQIFKKLEDGASYSEVADFLNEAGIEPGAYCRVKKWTCAMVSRFVFNPILKGLRVRNRKESRRINKTGRHRSFNAPQSMHLYRECPHLAFIDSETYDRVIALLKARNSIFARGVSNKTPDCRVGVPRKSTVWPGQHLKCGICNRIYIWGGHGVQAHMMCSGCRDYKCWNSTSVDGFEASKLLTEAVLRKIEELPDFDTVFFEKVREAVTRRRETRGQELASLDSEIRNIEGRIERITEAIATGSKSEALFSKLSSLEAELQFKKHRREQVLREPTDQFEMPSIDKIRNLARAAIENLARTSAEFGRIMTRLIPSLKVFPFRCCDGGAVVLRAVVKLDLASLIAIPEIDPETMSLFQTELVVDLFRPTQRVEFRERIKAMRAAGMSEKTVAKQLGLTVTATQRASGLTRLMEALGKSCPYLKITEPPSEVRWTRHLHKRFKFDPLVE